MIWTHNELPPPFIIKVFLREGGFNTKVSLVLSYLGKLTTSIIFNRRLWDIKMPVLNMEPTLNSKHKWKSSWVGAATLCSSSGPTFFICSVHAIVQAHWFGVHLLNSNLGTLLGCVLCRVRGFRRNFLCPQKNYGLIETRHTYTVLTVQSLHKRAGRAVQTQGCRYSEREEITLWGRDNRKRLLNRGSI